VTGLWGYGIKDFIEGQAGNLALRIPREGRGFEK